MPYNYHVPQFIEVEDKIVGPLTFKQFLYLLGGAGASFIFYRFLPFYVAVIFIVPVVALALALAFYKVNRRPFVFVLEAALKYFFGNKLYLWHRADKKIAPKEAAPSDGPRLNVPRVSQGKLRDLAWSLDVHEKIRN